jgi:hypothetical protein
MALRRLEVRGSAGAATIQWETAAERNTLGFNLWRAGSNVRAAAHKLTGTMIMATGNVAGAAYRFDDPTAPTGAHYWIEEVAPNGARTESGPATFVSVAAQPSQTIAPTFVAPVTEPTELALTRIAVHGSGELAPVSVLADAERGDEPKPTRSISLGMMMALSFGSAALLALLVLGISALMRRNRPRRAISV